MTLKKFEVRVRETVMYTVTVEAEDEDSAGEIACETWAESEDPIQDFQGNGLGVEVVWVKEADAKG